MDQEKGLTQDIMPDAAMPEPAPAGQRKPTLLMAVGLVALVAVLAAAAYVGGRLINPPKQMVEKGGGRVVMAKSSGPGGAEKAMRLEIEPAKELPTAAPEIAGVCDRRDENSLFVGTGNVRMMVARAADGSVTRPKPSFDGPVVEVVVTHETVIYRDDTELLLSPGDTESKRQQVVSLGTLDEIPSNSMISVWGEKRGERVIAQVLLYHP